MISTSWKHRWRSSGGCQPCCGGHGNHQTCGYRKVHTVLARMSASALPALESTAMLWIEMSLRFLNTNRAHGLYSARVRLQLGFVLMNQTSRKQIQIIYIYIYICIHTCVYIYIYIYIHKQLYIYTCMHTPTHTDRQASAPPSRSGPSSRSCLYRY